MKSDSLHIKSQQPIYLLTFFFLLLGSIFVFAQEPYSKIYAKREMAKLDKNRNGILEKTEAKKQWNSLSHLDIDGDDQLSLIEYANIKIPTLETKGTQKLNILYKSTPEEDLYLDIYYPNKAISKNMPFVMYTHGGGWFVGSKEHITKPLMKAHFLDLIDKGFAVVSINYRLVSHKTVAMRDCVIDAMDALRYLSKHKKNFRLDTDHVSIMGDSAGGQIAQMITLADPTLFPGDTSLENYTYKVSAGVSWYGPSDFTKTALFETSDATKNPDRFGNRILIDGMDASQKEFFYKEMSPVFYLTSQSPPLFIMAAENDTTIPVAHAYHMQQKADSINADIELFIVKNAGHNWRKAGGDINPSIEVIRKQTVDFILNHNR